MGLLEQLQEQWGEGGNQGYGTMANCMHCKINSLLYTLSSTIAYFTLSPSTASTKCFPSAHNTYTTSFFHVPPHIHLCFITIDVSPSPSHASIWPHSQAPPNFPLLAMWKQKTGEGRKKKEPRYQLTYHMYLASWAAVIHTNCWACSRLNNTWKFSLISNYVMLTREKIPDSPHFFILQMMESWAGPGIEATPISHAYTNTQKHMIHLFRHLSKVVDEWDGSIPLHGVINLVNV